MVTFCHQPPKLDLNSGFVPETSRSSPPVLNIARPRPFYSHLRHVKLDIL